VTSTDERDARVRALSSDGWSVRRIARETGLSKSQVHRVLTAAEEFDPWDDEDDELALFDGEDQPEPVPPFTYVGTQRVQCDQGRGEEPLWVDEERFVDGNARSVSRLDFYRWCQYRENDDGDYETADAVRADMERQIAEYEEREIRA